MREAVDENETLHHQLNESKFDEAQKDDLVTRLHAAESEQNQLRMAMREMDEQRQVSYWAKFERAIDITF